MPDLTVAAKDAALLALADQCVMCGLCVPHCPTYHLERHEAESPRGRIALSRMLANGVVPGAKAVDHLDHCLGCLSCQAVCPSNVDYEHILIRTRALLAPMRAPAARPWRWLSPEGLVRLLRFGLAVRAGRWMPTLAKWLPAGSLSRRVAGQMPIRAPAVGRAAAAPTFRRVDRRRIILFTGCVASVLDRDTLDGARVLLEALGHEVVEPSRTVCCGALALHAGETDAATRSAVLTRKTLSTLASDRVLVSASGCLGSLRDTLAGTALAVDDVAAFIARDPGFAALRFRALDQRVSLHVPCTQASVGDGGVATRALLARIPRLDLLALPAQPRCCGAAGTHFLEHPEHADRLRDEKLDQVAAQAPALLLTSNIGCRLFLDNGLRARDAAVPVLHPLALLARQLETSSA